MSELVELKPVVNGTIKKWLSRPREGSNILKGIHLIFSLCLYINLTYILEIEILYNFYDNYRH